LASRCRSIALRVLNVCKHLQQRCPDNIALNWALVLSCSSAVGAAAHLGSNAINRVYH
jgi:hypothetical protein